MASVRLRWVGVCVAVALIPASVARAQFSPGKLSRAHAALEGTGQCFKCHEPRKATTAARVADCFAKQRPCPASVIGSPLNHAATLPRACTRIAAVPGAERKRNHSAG